MILDFEFLMIDSFDLIDSFDAMYELYVYTVQYSTYCSVCIAQYYYYDGTHNIIMMDGFEIDRAQSSHFSYHARMVVRRSLV